MGSSDDESARSGEKLQLVSSDGSGKKSQEGNVMKEATDQLFLGAAMQLHALLANFYKVEVRAAYLGGSFAPIECNDEILQGLDMVRDRVLEGPIITGESTQPEELTRATQFVRDLLARRSETVEDDRRYFCKIKWSYATWRDYIRDLSLSPFWKTPSLKNKHKERGPGLNLSGGVREYESQPKDFDRDSQGAKDKNRGSVSEPRPSAEEYCRTHLPLLAHFSESGRESERSGISGRERSRQLPTLKIHESGGDSQVSRVSDGRSRPRAKGTQRRGAVGTCDSCVKRSETRSRHHHLRFSSSSGDSSSVSPKPESRVARYNAQAGHRRTQEPSRRLDTIEEALTRLNMRKDRVPPNKFNLAGGKSLGHFLREYEAYFEAKFDRSSEGQAILLKKFLTGPAEEIYDALNGSEARYEELKPRLLEWYGTERASKRRRNQEAFERAVRNPGERLGVYTLRLEEMARGAFPDEKERERELCRKFRRTAPADMKKGLEHQKMTLSLLGEYKMGWERIKTLSRTYDFCQRRNEREGQSPGGLMPSQELELYHIQPPPHEVSQKPLSQEGAYVPPGPKSSGGFKPRESRGSPRYGDNGRAKSPQRRDVPTCKYCGRKGHNERACWERNGYCMKCGSGYHHTDACEERGPQKEQPSCIFCAGHHWGKFCPKYDRFGQPRAEVSEDARRAKLQELATRPKGNNPSSSDHLERELPGRQDKGLGLNGQASGQWR